MSVFPIFYKITLSRIFELTNKGSDINNCLNLSINLFFMTTCVIIIYIPNLALDDITGFNGSVCCFIIVYLIPCLMHIVCYHGKNRYMQKM